ncbi:MAG TPA: universal stress protein [Terriglobales bacterium]|nr:universal stress protein [Terriglobales bacterium]
MAASPSSVDYIPKSVLVAYDFGETSQKPLQHGLAIARHFGAKLHVVHVVSSVGYRIAGAETLHMATDRTQNEMLALQQSLEKGGALKGLTHEFTVLEGDVWPRLEQLLREKQVGMVVTGTHGRGGLGKLLLGSVAEQIFRQAQCPVVTVGPGSQAESLVEGNHPVRPFLFATDFGQASLCALPYAATFAQHFRAKLIVLQVLPAAPIPEGFHWSKTGDLLEMREASKKASLEQFEKLVRPHLTPETDATFEVKFGTPGEQILLAAHEFNADLIVLGLNRWAHGGAASHSPWATAYKIVGTAHSPVLKIRNC